MTAQTSAMQGNIGRLKKFLREVRAELRKVTWPTRRELLSYTIIVFVTVVAIAILIWILDTALTKFLRTFIW